ncbi:anti-sigma factor [Nitrospirillum sp. BR 11828]|uniref:anti-sigma factor family protein n=1 Tax=Nitrospirillum sp. BR 11828 TaxID=3104325 RepID=UPI002ACA2AD4|nr:anti-sigma factor [Nitrospirillum sp. BR 11828]MDZ5647711.1 anti-sigma factor [Nitrospirillum sp. BR 11828]
MTAGRPITEEDLHAYVDGALDARRQAEVEAYLSTHAEAAHRVAAYAGQRAALRAALAPIAEEPVPDRLNLAHLIEARRHERARSWLPAAGAGPWRSMAAALALVLVGGVGGWSMHGMTAGKAPMTPVAMLTQEAMDNYRVYAADTARPVEMTASEQEQLLRWVSQRLDRKVAVPDLSAAGYRFMGGRLVATPHGPGAMFFYDDSAGNRIAMLVRPMKLDGDAPMTEHRKDAVGGVTWANSGLGYSLVADAPPQALHPLADEARRQLRAKI